MWNSIYPEALACGIVPGMALPLWRLPTPFTRGGSSRNNRNQHPRAHRLLLTAPGLPQTGSLQNLDNPTLESFAYFNVALPVETRELQEHFEDIELARRQLERMYSSETASTVKTDHFRFALLILLSEMFPKLVVHCFFGKANGGAESCGYMPRVLEVQARVSLLTSNPVSQLLLVYFSIFMSFHM